MIDQAFPPIADSHAKLIVLGSMPSQRSLLDRQYYAHPQNAFWWIMSKIFDFDHKADYEHRQTIVRAQGIAIWDVLSACERPGSLDADIIRGSEQFNRFDDLLIACPQLRCFLFNGATAYKLFARANSQLLNHSGLEFHRLPSTSPAHASMSRQQKLVQWSEIIRTCLS